MLSPVKNAKPHLERYFSLLANLTYPAHLLSLGVLDSDSDDALTAADITSIIKNGYTANETKFISGTMGSVLLHLPRLVAIGWSRVSIGTHNFGYSLSSTTRHDLSEQFRRRATLARSRNRLLSLALRDEVEWVLWIDSDLTSYSPNVLDELLNAGRDIVVPNVVVAPGGRSYDLNSWRDPDGPGDDATPGEVLEFHNSRSKHGAPLRLEGYGQSTSLSLHNLRNGPSVRRLDGVGGGMLLVRASLHREGLVFPQFPYRGRMETEGMSMLALDMGVLSFGMPNVEVIHC